jgi:hypothetical protein
MATAPITLSGLTGSARRFLSSVDIDRNHDHLNRTKRRNLW